MRISDWSSDVCSSDLDMDAAMNSRSEKLTIRDARVVVTCPGRNFVTLVIETDQGVTGIGDATLNGRELAVASYLSDHVIPNLIGRDAHRIEDMWQFLYRGAYRSEEHTSELQSLMRISYAVFCLKKKKKIHSLPTQSISQQ